MVVLDAEGTGYSRVHLSEEESFITRSGLNYYEEFLPSPDFMRVHRSYIIQLERIDSIDFSENSISIMGKSIPLSRSKQRDLAVLLQKVV